jgi:hypothetical protein
MFLKGCLGVCGVKRKGVIRDMIRDGVLIQYKTAHGLYLCLNAKHPEVREFLDKRF